MRELLDRLDDDALGVSFLGLGDEIWCTYADLRRQAWRVAAELSALGVRPGDAVAVELDNSPEAVGALLGVWAAGATVVSLPPPAKSDVSDGYRAGLLPVLERLGIETLLGSDRVGRILGSVVAHHLTCDALAAAAARRDAVDPRAETPQIALIQFTSGSTGMPRGVAIRHDSLIGHLAEIATALEVRNPDAATSWLPLHHDMGLVGMFLTSIWARCPLTLMTPRSFARNPISWLERCAATRSSLTAAPNFAYRLATLSLGLGTFTGDLSSLRVCLCGAERVSARVMREFIAAGARYGLPPAAVMPVYGLAEATLAVSFPPLRRPLRDGPGDTVSVGFMLPGIESRVVETDEQGRGRLELRGPWMLDHYVTAAGAVSPFDDDGWYPTNDIVSVTDGELYVHGRSDEVAIVRGRNVYAEDIESVVASVAGERLGFHAAFRVDADAFGVAGEWLGFDGTRPEDLVAEIRRTVVAVVGARLHSVRLCHPRTLPMTTSGKVKRSMCRAMTEHDRWPAKSILAAG